MLEFVTGLFLGFIFGALWAAMLLVKGRKGASDA